MLLSENISEQIKQLILDGTFPLGEKIPSEQELASLLGVSRNTIRDAVKLLVSKNILNIERGIGTYVSLKPGIVDDPFGLEFMDKDKLPSYLSEIRMMIEPQITFLAAQKATIEEIEELGKISSIIMHNLEKYLEDERKTEIIDLIIEADLSFHNLIYRMCRNPVLPKIFPVITKNIFEIYTTPYFRKALVEVYKMNTHYDIYLAMKENDPIKAKDLMIQHLKNPYIIIEKYKTNKE